MTLITKKKSITNIYAKTYIPHAILHMSPISLPTWERQQEGDVLNLALVSVRETNITRLL
jgi:hypothetical protein